jgi:replication factor C subunit 1
MLGNRTQRTKNKKKEQRTKMFSDKYRPKTTKQVVGASYAAASLMSWARLWNTPQRAFRAALLSGPPGIGKSVLADLVCAESGLPNVLRIDSSRKRTKKALEEIEEVFGSRKIDAYLTGRMQRSKPGAVIIDDLDAMIVGGADRGGVLKIVAFIKTSKIPVICVCNDANHRSLKPLVAQCMHIRFFLGAKLKTFSKKKECRDRRWNRSRSCSGKSLVSRKCG